MEIIMIDYCDDNTISVTINNINYELTLDSSYFLANHHHTFFVNRFADSNIYDLSIFGYNYVIINYDGQFFYDNGKNRLYFKNIYKLLLSVFSGLIPVFHDTVDACEIKYCTDMIHFLNLENEKHGRIAL